MLSYNLLKYDIYGSGIFVYLSPLFAVTQKIDLFGFMTIFSKIIHPFLFFKQHNKLKDSSCLLKASNCILKLWDAL